jgi:hypothetical protein
MQILKVTTWADEVFPCWQRNAHNANNPLRPNSEIWEPLPSGIVWSLAKIESPDISRLFLLGSSDFKDTFTTYQVSKIQTPFPMGSQDRHHYQPLAMLNAMRGGKTFDPPICIAESMQGNIMFIDGNHRTLMHLLNSSLIGMETYLGILPGIHSQFLWSHPAR